MPGINQPGEILLLSGDSIPILLSQVYAHDSAADSKPTHLFPIALSTQRSTQCNTGNHHHRKMFSVVDYLAASPDVDNRVQLRAPSWPSITAL